MATTPWLASVSKINNGQDVSAEVVNPIIKQLTQREQHLFEKLADIEDRSVLISSNLPVLPAADSFVNKYTVVFYDQEGSGGSLTKGLAPAQVKFSVPSAFSSAYTPDNSAFVAGIVKERVGDNADVYTLGYVLLDTDIDAASGGLMPATEATLSRALADFSPGPFYLSGTDAGKLTRNPGGVAIYVGYAFSRREFLLAPNVSEFNQFFTTYQFNLLDRAAGIPELVGDEWTATGTTEVNGDGGINHVGFIPSDSADLSTAITSLMPTGAKFFYNLPTAELISQDTGINEAAREEQTELARTLPPNPTNVTLLTVNGVIQSNRENSDDGSYLINSAGIWWFDDLDGFQPWASDTTQGKTVTFNSTTNKITLADGAFELADRLRFKLSGGATLPSPLLENTTYYVVAIEQSGDDQLIQIATAEDGAVIDFDNTASGTIIIPNFYVWKFDNGTPEYRPRLSLQFLKFNPSLRESIVTSLRPYNTGSSAIQFFRPDKSATATTGDLLARLQLGMTSSELTTAARAVSDFTYDESTGLITKQTIPVVSNLIPGSGITLTQQQQGGVNTPGSYVISANASSQTGRVNSIEPDGAELLYTGLHSYLNLPPASTLPSSLIGKILLPSTVPDSDMTFVLLLIGDANLGLGATARNVEFDFSYSITKTGTVLGAATTPVSVSFAVPNTVSAYTAKTPFKVGAVTAGTFSIPNSTLRIPASLFRGGDCAVNFKLTRKTPTNPYASNVGVVEIYWKIG